MAAEAAYVFIAVVSLAILATLGINLYLMLKSRRHMQNNASQYSALHQRLDVMAEIVKNQAEQHHRLARLISELNLDKENK